MNITVDRRMIALTAAIMAVLMLATPFAGLASDAAAPTEDAEKNTVGYSFVKDKIEYTITEIATWTDNYGGYYDAPGKVQVTSLEGITTETSLIVPTYVTNTIATGEYGAINAGYNVTAIADISGGLGTVTALYVDETVTTEINASLNEVKKSHGVEWAYLTVNDPSAYPVESKHVIIKDTVVDIADYPSAVYSMVYTDATGATPANMHFTMGTEDVNWFYLNVDGIPFAFYIDLTDDGADNGVWKYDVPADGLASTALNNIAGSMDGADAISGTGFITTFNDISSVGTYGTTGYKSFGVYCLDDGTWKYSNGLNTGESRTYAITYGEYFAAAPETGAYYESYNNYIPMPGPGVLTNGLANAATVNASAGGNVTITYTPENYPSAAGGAIRLYFDGSALTYNGASSLIGGSVSLNEADLAGNGKFVGLAIAGDSPVSTANGMITANFTVNPGFAGGEITMYSITTEITDGNDPAAGGPVSMNTIVMGIPEIVSGDVVTLPLSGDAENIIEIEYDTSVMSFASATNSISVIESRIAGANGNDGIVVITTNGNASIVEFVINDNPRVGSTTVTANGDDKVYEISGTSYVIVPAVSNGSSTVSLYDVPKIAGFEMKFSYTGDSTPIVDKASSLTGGTISANIDTGNKTISIVWAGTNDVDLNGQILEIRDVTGLTLIPGNITMMTSDLESVFADVSDEKPSVDVPGFGNKRDLNGDGNVDLSDLVILMQYLTNYDVDITGNGNADADFNNDGQITIRDAMNLSKYLSEHA